MMAHGAERISTVHCPFMKTHLQSYIHAARLVRWGGKYINVYPLHEKAKIYIYNTH